MLRVLCPLPHVLYGMVAPCFGHAADPSQQANPPRDRVQQLEEIEIKEKAVVDGVTVTPAATVIDLDEFKTIGPQTSIIDVLKTRAAVDFRGDNSLDPGVDSIFLRGFDASRFVTAIDGLTLQKTGGRKSSNIVDYSLLPTFLIEEIERQAAELVPEIPLYYTSGWTVYRPATYDGWMNMYDHHAMQHSKLSYLERTGPAVRR